MPYMPDEIAILGAEQYGGGVPRRGSTTRKPTPRSADEEGEPSRKRAKASTLDSADADDGEKKKSRGRPRLESKDETAVDRRRTQIRLAQRAYRNRKDNALHLLEQEVRELKDDNETMSNALMDLHDAAVTQGLLDASPEFARKFRETTAKFLELARKSAHSSDKGSGPTTEASAPPQTGRKAGKRLTRSPQMSELVPELIHSPPTQQAKPVQLWAGLVVSDEPQAETHDVDITMATTFGSELLVSTTFDGLPSVPSFDFEIITEPTEDNASYPFGLPVEPDLHNILNPASKTSLSAPNIPTASTTTTSLATSTVAAIDFMTQSINTPPYSLFPMPNSYAYRERTFGRRLQRAALEHGLAILQMENPPAKLYAAVFGFCLLFEPREKILVRLKEAINKSDRDSLHHWKHPFLHLNGAGTFFEDINSDMSSIEDGQLGTSLSVVSKRLPVGNEGTIQHFQPQDKNAKFSIGPWSQEVEQTKDSLVDEKMRIMDPAFAGEFYDPDEVDYYLQQRGVLIPQGADWVVAEIDMIDFSNEHVKTGADSIPPSRDSANILTSITRYLPHDVGHGVTTDALPMPEYAHEDPSMRMPDVIPDLDASAPLAEPHTSSIDSLFGSDIFSAPTTAVHATGTSPSMGVDATPLVMFAGMPTPPTVGLPSNKIQVKFEAESLVKELVRRTVCLGRSPGIRPEDVNKAFKIAAGLDSLALSMY